MHSSVLLFLNIGSSEMILIVFVALLLFGGEKLPEIARGLGKGIRDFKDASEGVKREINNQINSYEEKRTETALDVAAQNHLSSSTDQSADSRPPVENTMPINENHFTASDEHQDIEKNGSAVTGETTDNPIAFPHSDTETVTEITKSKPIRV
ncbi:MAG TPA: twin-arginine translocase TatA/TatE family subunit [Mucilaginibacter sp.]